MIRNLGLCVIRNTVRQLPCLRGFVKVTALSAYHQIMKDLETEVNFNIANNQVTYPDDNSEQVYLHVYIISCSVSLGCQAFPYEV